VELHVQADDWTVSVSSPQGGHGVAAEEAVPAAAGAVRNAYFVPRLCMQCENPPCTWVCPVSATYRTEDGVVLVDEKRCIGCGYCLVACPYGARYMVPAGDTTPKGVPGVADKCTFCYHRITRGLLPACAEVCPVNARIFGDLNDPASPVSVALDQKRVRAMKTALGTRPRVYYTGLEGEVD
jgi:Fe-S-cluster-containing dehydrogenase component